MTVVKPKIELTKNEIDAIDTVITMCKNLGAIDINLLKFVFDNDLVGRRFAEVIDVLNNILDSCEY